MSALDITWEDTLTDDSRLTADCQDCDWHREGVGAEVTRAIIWDANEHMKLGHYIKAELT